MSYKHFAAHLTAQARLMVEHVCTALQRAVEATMVLFSRSLNRVAVIGMLLPSLLAVSGPTRAQTASSNTATLTARLSGASVVPPTPSNGGGVLQAALDKQSRVLTWTISVQGLSGLATAASFHGPAMPGENAEAALPIALGAGNGSVTLTSAQVDDLMAGRWYVSVQTAANPNGEIRGQVMIGR